MPAVVKNDSGPPDTKYAHFEDHINNRLMSLYTRHAEVARDIHENTLRQFIKDRYPDKPELAESPDLKVDLVRMSALSADKAVLERLSDYDSVSVSSGLAVGSLLDQSNLHDRQNTEMARSFFRMNEMPIYTVSAGNEGGTERKGKPRLADFSRTSLVVGEARISKDGALIEKHSSKINPTLACDSPFNRGERYQYVDFNPSLAGHEDLIRDWLVKKTALERFDAFKSNTPSFLAGKSDADIMDFVLEEFRVTNFSRSDAVNEQIIAYLENPESLHAIMKEELYKRYGDKGLDDEGYLTGIDGTSFAGPEQAGYVSGALYEQEIREDMGLPILTKEEISALVKMATYDTQDREAAEFQMAVDKNKAGTGLTYAGGHGVFSPEMFKDLLDEAYARIERDPDIDREVVELRANSTILPDGNHDKYVFGPVFPDREDIVIERIRFDFDFSELNGMIPHEIDLYRDGQRESTMRMQLAGGDRLDYDGWLRSEDHLGETLKSGEKWEVRIPGSYSGETESANITVYGYNKGGLMDQMMQFSQKVALGYDPKHNQDQNEPKLVGDVDNEAISQTPEVTMKM